MSMQTDGSHEKLTALIETRSLSRKVGDRTLVDNVSVSIAQGEILAITGPSGAGKSSFLRLINRLDEPSSGLHPADTAALLHALDKLKVSGNSLFVVEHDLDVTSVAFEIRRPQPAHSAHQ